MTGLAIDRLEWRSIWMGLEAEGIRHSADGGNTGVPKDEGIPRSGTCTI